jgi:hypothetical protein
MSDARKVNGERVAMRRLVRFLHFIVGSWTCGKTRKKEKPQSGSLHGQTKAHPTVSLAVPASLPSCRPHQHPSPASERTVQPDGHGAKHDRVRTSQATDGSTQEGTICMPATMMFGDSTDVARLLEVEALQGRSDSKERRMMQLVIMREVYLQVLCVPPCFHAQAFGIVVRGWAALRRFLLANVKGHVRRDEARPDQTPSSASHVPSCSGSSFGIQVRVETNPVEKGEDGVIRVRDRRTGKLREITPQQGEPLVYQRKIDDRWVTVATSENGKLESAV